MSGYTTRTGGPRARHQREHMSAMEKLYEFVSSIDSDIDNGGRVSINHILPKYESLHSNIPLSQLPMELKKALTEPLIRMKKGKMNMMPYARTEEWRGLRRLFQVLIEMIGKYLNRNNYYGQIGKCFAGSCHGAGNATPFSRNNLGTESGDPILAELQQQYSMNARADEDRKFYEEHVDALAIHAPNYGTYYEHARDRGYTEDLDFTDISSFKRINDGCRNSVPLSSGTDYDAGERRGYKYFPSYGGIGHQTISNDVSFAPPNFYDSH